jgi:hypothetical protein
VTGRNGMTPKQQALLDKAERERAKVRDWLLELMGQSPDMPATKAKLCAIAQAKFSVSKNAFDAGRNTAIIETGNEHWWEPLPRAARLAKCN